MADRFNEAQALEILRAKETGETVVVGGDTFTKTKADGQVWWESTFGERLNSTRLTARYKVQGGELTTVKAIAAAAPAAGTRLKKDGTPDLRYPGDAARPAAVPPAKPKMMPVRKAGPRKSPVERVHAMARQALAEQRLKIERLDITINKAVCDHAARVTALQSQRDELEKEYLSLEIQLGGMTGGTA